ncbi:SusC/RagA family TonB-linked outer membrane protein [Autumnicola musiva]|uniref:SusC/RagA family TonB-linked outer membrane protein n=1 Tax=Autumnicola musiva TaxID=3075589 RepID=A0ABU3DAF8_9FLAO|nr:SusC/RagA family TonB-linked outer membrane protein [Zunongwangia sp. F117]MDT0678334.1 SusC/RagA family TonB-linked outer membrane protein [Zunongwangia sp. F117]
MIRIILKKCLSLGLLLIWLFTSYNTIAQQHDGREEYILYADTSDIHIGYELKRSLKELTGAVDVIEGSNLPKSRTIINPANSLYGQSAGLQVLQNAGEPPVSPTIFIRGQGTFGNNSPLVLVDGFEQPFDALSIEEIENISVLKDAPTLAMYGQRGANGVVLVTTKRGKKQALEVEVSFEQSFTQPIVTPNFLQASTYAQAVNEALQNDGLSSRYTTGDIEAYESGSSPYLYPNVDWADETLRDLATRSNLNFSFKGGGEIARYFAMVNYVRDVGIYREISAAEDYDTQLKYGKFNFRSNLDIDITSDLLLKINVGGNLMEKNAPDRGISSNNIFGAIYSIPSAAFPVRTPDGNLGGTPIYGNNPVATLTSTGYSRPNEREVSFGGTLRQSLDKLIEGLNVEASIRYNNNSRFDEGQSRNYTYQSLFPVRNNNGDVVDYTTTEYGQDTDLNFFGGLDSQRTYFDIVGKMNYERNFGNNELKGTVLFHQNSRSLRGQNNTYHGQNVMTNLHYGISEKYFINLTASYNGYNVLPAGERFGFFPAVSVAWMLSDEDFLRNSEFLDWLKIRASWGMSGNGADRLPNNNYYESTYGGGSGYWFRNGNNFRSGNEEDRLGSPNFTYATSQTTNIGVDVALFNKLNFSSDLFYSRRDNILSGTGGGYSQVLGINPPMTSSGIVNNKGIETSLHWRDAIGNVNYNIGGNFSFTRNKIEEINEQYRPYDYLQRTGKRVGQFFGLEAIGFFEDQNEIDNSPSQSFGEVKPGDIRYRDQNGDNVINEFDEVSLGYAGGYPEIYFSFSFGAEYKGFGISALLQGTGNQTAFLNTSSVFWPLTNNNNISEYYYDRRWTNETMENATLPRLTTEDNANNFQSNSIWLRSKSYAKLRNLEISYTLPNSLDSWNMKSLQIYLSGRNLFSIDNIPIMDPEQLSASYPLLRSYQLGLEMKF